MPTPISSKPTKRSDPHANPRQTPHALSIKKDGRHIITATFDGMRWELRTISGYTQCVKPSQFAFMLNELAENVVDGHVTSIMLTKCNPST